MARYYGRGGSQFAVYGEQEGVPDGSQVDGKLSYEAGFGPDYSKDLLIDPSGKNISRKQFNNLLYDITDTIGKLQRQGCWEWQSDIWYARGYQVIHNDDCWLCVSAHSGSEPYSGNTNWIRMVEVFQQVGVSTKSQIQDGSVFTAPMKGTGIHINGRWEAAYTRIDRDCYIDVSVNGSVARVAKVGNRNGGSGHGYYSNFHFAFAHTYPLYYNKGDQIYIGISGSGVAGHELFIEFLGY